MTLVNRAIRLSDEGEGEGKAKGKAGRKGQAKRRVDSDFARRQRPAVRGRIGQPVCVLRQGQRGGQRA